MTRPVPNAVALELDRPSVKPDDLGRGSSVTPASDSSGESQNQRAPLLLTADNPDGEAPDAHRFGNTVDGHRLVAIGGLAQRSNPIPAATTASQPSAAIHPSSTGHDSVRGQVGDGTLWNASSAALTDTGSAGLTGSFVATTTPIILAVGRSGQYRTISAAVAFADADTDLSHSYDIRVSPGTYTN